MKAQGYAEAKMVEVDASNYSNLKAAEVISQVAEKNADTLRIEGNGEAELKAVLANRRLYEYLNSKLDIIKSLARNPNFKLFGNQQDKALSQIAAYRLLSTDGKF